MGSEGGCGEKNHVRSVAVIHEGTGREASTRNVEYSIERHCKSYSALRGTNRHLKDFGLLCNCGQPRTLH